MMTTTDAITVDQATVLEWPQIEALRRTFFERQGLPVQREGRAGCRWYVARRGERVLGAYSVQDVPGQRWALDFFRVDGRDGARSIFAMRDHLRAEAIADGVPVYFHALLENEPWLAMLVRRGEASPVSVLLQFRTTTMDPKGAV